MGAYNGYKNGYLPDPGGLNDQAAKFGEIMAVLDNAVHETDEVIRKNNSRKGGGGGSLLGK